MAAAAALLATILLGLTAQPANADAVWNQVHQEAKPGPHQGVRPPAGDPSEWSWANGDAASAVRWDPCTPITWSTPADGSALEAAFARAVRQVARFSGYTFQRVETGAVLTARLTTQAEIVAMYGASSVAAYAWADGATRPGSGSTLWATRGTIVVWDGMLSKGWRSELPSLFLHEIGHVMGLGHVPSADQLMYQGGPPGDRYGAGDRAGLAAMRAGLDCAPPGPVGRSMG